MSSELKEILNGLATATILCIVLTMPAMMTGCERKEKVLDIETPNGELEVERDKSDGDVDVEINEN